MTSIQEDGCDKGAHQLYLGTIHIYKKKREKSEEIVYVLPSHPRVGDLRVLAEEHKQINNKGFTEHNHPFENHGHLTTNNVDIVIYTGKIGNESYPQN